MLVTPIVADNPLEAFAVKQAVLNNMRRLFAEKKVRRYAIAAECWKSSAGVSRDEEESARRYAELGYTLANAPDREEVVCLSAVDDREVLMAFRAIVRPAHGRAHLGMLGEIERPSFARTEFLDLLPREFRDAS